MDHNTLSNITVIATAHDFSDPQRTTLMHRDIVGEFLRTYESDLTRPDTLLIVEGDPDIFTGNPRILSTYKSPRYGRMISTLFGKERLYPLKCSITAADYRDNAYFDRVRAFMSEIVKTGALKAKSADMSSERITREDTMKMMLGTFDHIAYIEDECHVSWQDIANHVFGNSRSAVERKRSEISSFLISGCDNAIMDALRIWQGWFRKTFVIAGGIHATNIASTLGLPRHDMLPAVTESNLHFSLPTQEDATALSIICCDQCYDKIKEYCDKD